MANTLLHQQDVIILLFGSVSSVIVLAIATLLSLPILWQWDIQKSDKRQYRLEKRSWLIATIIGFVAGIKLLLLPYFIFTIDALSHIVPGAMCGAGVISYNHYGMPLLLLKVIAVALILFWLLFHYYDIHHLYRWIRTKMVLVSLIFIIALMELWWEYHFFSAIDIHQVVHCCATLYGLLEGMNPLPWGLSRTQLLLLFFLLYALLVSSTFAHLEWIFAFALVLFGIIAYYSILYLFGPYIYEQPNHNCPFCMMQKSYHYVGYGVWGLYFIGLFLGVWSLFAQKGLKHTFASYRHYALIALGLLILLLMGYVIAYYYQHHTLLQEVQTTGMMMEM